MLVALNADTLPSPGLAGFQIALQYDPLVTNFFADLVCDDSVDTTDVQVLLDSFRTTQGECAFNPDVDVALSGTIDATDLQRLLNRFGAVAPF